MQSALILNLAKEATMSLSRIRLGWAIAVIVVLAAALVPAAGARTRGVEPKNPWYAYDAALRKAQNQRQEQSVAHRTSGVQPTSPWYAYDAALRKAQNQRHQQSVGYRFITDTLGGGGGGNKVQ
jgi:hypothetical protein